MRGGGQAIRNYEYGLYNFNMKNNTIKMVDGGCIADLSPWNGVIEGNSLFTNQGQGLILYGSEYMQIINNEIKATEGCIILCDESNNIDIINNSLYNYNSTNSCALYACEVNCKIINNAIVNDGGSSTSGVIYIPQNPVNMISNYNVFYSTSGKIGYRGGSPANNMSAWKTLSGKDLNSISADPEFVDPHNPGGMAISRYSMLVGRANTQYLPVYDINGTFRTQNCVGAYDITEHFRSMSQETSSESIYDFSINNNTLEVSSSKLIGNAQIKISDALTGAIRGHYNLIFKNENDIQQIDISSLSSGIYIITIISSDGTFSKKMSKL